MDIIIYFIFCLFGYIVGRTSHKYFNVWVGDPVWIPHHWIFGLVVFLAGVYCGISWILFFGAGLFISDLDDFFELRFFSKDGPGPKKFWDID